MTASAPSLKKFLLHTFPWLPLCSAVCFLIAPCHSAVVGTLARVLVNQLTNKIVSARERARLTVMFVTTIKVQPELGQTALLTP